MKKFVCPASLIKFDLVYQQVHVVMIVFVETRTVGGKRLLCLSKNELCRWFTIFSKIQLTTENSEIGQKLRG